MRNINDRQSPVQIDTGIQTGPKAPTTGRFRCVLDLRRCRVNDRNGSFADRTRLNHHRENGVHQTVDLLTPKNLAHNAAFLGVLCQSTDSQIKVHQTLGRVSCLIE